jgi:ArsR family transcriptional regulator
MDDKELSKYFKAIGQPTRLRLLFLLCCEEPGGMAVSDIAARCGLSQPVTSRHLSILEQVGAVNSRRDGRRVLYSVNAKKASDCCTKYCMGIRITPPNSRCD